MANQADIGVDPTSDEDSLETKKERGIATRKSNKPLIEKRRRARINECLQQLKDILVQERHLDNARCNRLEKADILEMTVDYIRQLSREGSSSSFLQNAYDLGAERCVQEMSEFMSSQPDFSDVSENLASHCRKMLRRHELAADVIKQLHGNKRTNKSKLETVADSSTSPKRYKMDSKDDSNLHVSGDNDLIERDVYRSGEESQTDTVSSTKSTSLSSIAAKSNLVPTSLLGVAVGQSSSACTLSSTTIIHPETDCCHISENTGDEKSPTISNARIPEPSVETPTSPVTTNLPHNLIYALNSNQQKGFSINSSPVIASQPAPGHTNQPVFVTCPGNILILLGPNPVLPQVVPQSLVQGTTIPKIPNTVTVIPTSVLYQLVDTTTTIMNTRVLEQNTSNACDASIICQPSLQRKQTTGNNCTSTSLPSFPLPQNPGIIFKHESESRRRDIPRHDGDYQYMFLPQHQQVGTGQVYQHDPNVFSHVSQVTQGSSTQKSHYNINTPRQIDQHYHNIPIHASQQNCSLSAQVSSHRISHSTASIPSASNLHGCTKPLKHTNTEQEEIVGTVLLNDKVLSTVQTLDVTETSNGNVIPNSTGDPAYFHGPMQVVHAHSRTGKIGDSSELECRRTDPGLSEAGQPASQTLARAQTHEIESRETDNCSTDTKTGDSQARRDLRTSKNICVNNSSHEKNNCITPTPLKGFLAQNNRVMSGSLAHLVENSTSDDDRIVNRLQESSGLLDLSRKVEVCSNYRSESTVELDMNNNITDTGSGENIIRNQGQIQQTVSSLIYNGISDDIYKGLHFHLVTTKDASGHVCDYNGAYVPSSNIYCRTDHVDVWRPWGDQQKNS